MSDTQGQATLKLEMDVLAANSQDIKGRIKDAISDDSSGLIIDLENVQQVDSVGVGVLIATYNSLRKQNKEFRLINVNSRIFELLQVMRLNRHFDIEVTQDG